MSISVDNPNIFQKGACVVAGSYVANKIPNLVKKNNPTIKIAIEAIDGIPNISKKQTDMFIQSMLNNTVLQKSKFNAKYVVKENIKDLSNSVATNITNSIDNLFKLFKLPSDKKQLSKLREIYAVKFSEMLNLVKDGQNAFYHPIVNTAYYPKNKPFFLAHEIGHAINANLNIFSKGFISAARIFPVVTTMIIPAVAIWKSFGNKDSNDKSFVQKHAGKIVASSFIPMVAEEGLASLRAINAAKVANLSRETIKGMKKGYGLAFSTYLAWAGVAALSTTLATKLFSKKDNL